MDIILMIRIFSLFKKVKDLFVNLNILYDFFFRNIIDTDISIDT